MNAAKKRPRSPWSCHRFISYAIVFTVLFLSAHLLGFREQTAVLSGTSVATPLQQICGLVYILLYLCFVAFVPILLIASAVVKALGLLRAGKGA